MKNNRLIAFLLASVMLFSAMPVGAAVTSGLKDVPISAENSEVISASIPQLNQYKIVEGTDFDVQLDFSITGSTPKFYGIEVLVDGVKYDETRVTAEPNIPFKKVVHISNVKQGQRTITVNVTSSGLNVYSNEMTVNAIRPYEPQFMDRFSGRGLVGFSANEMSGYYFDLIGFKNIRAASSPDCEWGQIEKTKGVFNFSVVEKYNKTVSKNNPTWVYLLAYNNVLYNGMPEWPGKQYGPTTATNIEAYGKYASEVAKRYKQAKYLEFYNEPNIQFWKPDSNVHDYAYMCEAASRVAKMENPDSIITVGSASGGWGDWPAKIMKDGAYGNVDAFSYHPYIYPTKVDNGLDKYHKSNRNAIITYGGWKEQIITEVGWPTHIGSTGISREQQAIESVKCYVSTDAYGIKVNELYCLGDGNDVYSNEMNFGIVAYDKSPKPVAITLKEFFQRTNGGQHMGKMILGENQIGHMYLRNNKITAIMWQKAGTEESVCDLGKTVSVYDIYGNYLYTDSKIKLTEEPVYVEGLSKDCVVSYISENIKDVFNNGIEALKSMKELEGYEKAKEILYNAAEITAGVTAIPTEEKALEMLEEYYAAGDKILEMNKNGEFAGGTQEASSFLYILHLGGNLMTKLYIASCGSELGDYECTSYKDVDKAEKTISERAGRGTLVYSESMVKFADTLKNELSEVREMHESNVIKTGIIKAWDKTASLLALQAEKMSEDEKMGYANIMLQLPSSQCGIETNVEKAIYPTLYNYTLYDITGDIELVDPDGVVLAKTENITVEKDHGKEIPLKVLLEEVKETDDDKQYKLRYVENGTVIEETVAYLKIQKSLDVKIVPAKHTFNELNEIEVTVENLVDNKFEGTVEITSPEGWELGVSSKNVSVEGKKKESVKFSISKKKSVPYHFYNFGITVKNMDGRVIYTGDNPLSFSTVIKADKEYYTENFDGDISDWSNAYPFYPGLPEDATELASWSDSTVASRVLTKWDENYIYYMVDVFDDVHIQIYETYDIWAGDSVQISIDPNNDKNDNKYSTEDYEYGFTHSDKNGNESHAWTEAGRKGGVMPSEWTAMLRDNNLKLSRYLIKLPTSAVTPLKLQKGSKFGCNVVVNDADWQGRERWIELVPGTGAAKAPSLYPDFVLTDSEKVVKSDVVCPIPATILTSSDRVQFEAAFTDIEGHWAEQVINEFAESGYVSGVGDNKFEPNRNITRAEFLMLFAKSTGFDKSSDQKVTMFSAEDKQEKEVPKAYFDVESSKWYAVVVYNAKAAGLLDENIADVFFYPEREITREEAFHIMNTYLISKGDTGLDSKSLSDFSDVEEISEWAKKAIMNLYGKGIVNGDNNKKINPQKSLTRAEVCVSMAAMLNN